MSRFDTIKDKMRFAKFKLLLMFTMVMSMVASVSAANETEMVDISALVIPLIDQVVSIIPSIINLIIAIVPAVIVLAIVGFIVKFLDDILKMLHL